MQDHPACRANRSYRAQHSRLITGQSSTGAARPEHASQRLCKTRKRREGEQWSREERREKSDEVDGPARYSLTGASAFSVCGTARSLPRMRAAFPFRPRR